MSDKADNHLVAAHLAAALVLKLERTSLPAKDAVSLYFEVLKTLEEEQDARNSAGVNSPSGKEDITAAVAASKPIDEPKDGYSSEWDEDADRSL